MLDIFKQPWKSSVTMMNPLGEDEMHAAVQAAKTAFCNVMVLQYERFEEMAPKFLQFSK